ncbi:hypothetical protein [Bacillus subtilis]|uniref:Uncharacterized protein n=1 Tax=Bacillus subtilis subsp. subtilis TaxID=135461 RepID=A0ABD3ZV25_BACIU|nr:hypothetical protein [Bacillus subtilis]KIL32000.1 hypothetical protein B4067_2273 [Bacillus subtilis subsp. subtilis]KIN58116.1 hypothetical protein B4145_2188 [Bacillus subtilis]
MTETTENVVVTIPDKTSFIFHETTTAPSEGEEFVVGHFRELTVKISGSSTSREVKFYAVDEKGEKTPLSGTNKKDFQLGASTLNTNEYWDFDIAGLFKVMFEVVSVNGDISVKGIAVS